MASNPSSLRDSTQPTASATDLQADSTAWHATLEAASRVLRFHASEFAALDSSNAPGDGRVTEGAPDDDSMRVRA
ncbi:MAG: hypothetical protein IT390_01160 [Nitrospira sp.]|nr:hypothetical protein [Nitrospira sp.]